jgi:hypothetical protein
LLEISRVSKVWQKGAAVILDKKPSSIQDIEEKQEASEHGI